MRMIITKLVCLCVCASTGEVTQGTRTPDGLIGSLVIWLQWNSVSFKFCSDCPQAHKRDLTFTLILGGKGRGDYQLATCFQLSFILYIPESYRTICHSCLCTSVNLIIKPVNAECPGNRAFLAMCTYICFLHYRLLLAKMIKCYKPLQATESKGWNLKMEAIK